MLDPTTAIRFDPGGLDECQRWSVAHAERIGRERLSLQFNAEAGNQLGSLSEVRVARDATETEGLLSVAFRRRATANASGDRPESPPS